MRHTLLFCLAAVAAFAQGPAATVQILPPSFRILAGDRMQIRAVVRDASGVERPNDIPQWSVNNASISAIEQFNGEFRANNLGIVQVTARIGSTVNSVFIQILPKKVVVTPANAILTVGQQMQFRGQALDKNDQPLPNISFRWFTSSGNGFTTNTSSINASGMLNTVAVGNILVRASYDYNTGVPGFERQAQSVSTVQIRPPQSYRLSKLLSTGDMRPGPFRLRPRNLPLVGNEAGQVVFNASLDGMANGPLMLDGGNQTLLLWGGMPGPLPQTSIIEFSQLAINNRGDVLALASVLFSGGVIYKINRDGADAVFAEQMPLPGTEFLSSPFLNRNCLNDSGDFVFRANYRVANQGPVYTALFRVPERGFPDEVISTRMTLPDLASPFTLDNDFGAAGNGVVYFTATASGRRALYVSRYGDPPKKLLALGDPLMNSTVAQFYGNGFWVNNDGDLVVALRLQNNTIHLLRYPGADPAAAPQTLQLRSFGAIFGVSPSAGVLFNGDVGRGGYGVHLWKGSDTTPLILQSVTRLRGKLVIQVSWATVSGSGEVKATVLTEDNPFEIVSIRAGEDPVSILASGDPVSVQAPVSISNLLPGDKMGPAHVLLGGRNSSIFEISERGLKPAILMGERFNPTTQLYTGSGTGDSRKSGLGDIFVTQTSGAGIVRVRGDSVEVIQRPGFALEDGATANAPANVVANVRGDLLWQASTNRGDSRLVLTQNGKHTTLLTNSALPQMETVVDGKAVTGWGDQVVDDAGRVMATLRFRDTTTGVYLWESGQWRWTAAVNEIRHTGAVVIAISQIKAAADNFYAIFNLQGIGNTLVRYRGGLWETVIGVTDPLVTGHQANSIGAYDVNRNGDVFAQCNTNTQVLVVKKGGKTYYVHMLSELTADGDLLARTGDFDIRDDGTLYFLGMTVLDDYAVYMAKPIP